MNLFDRLILTLYSLLLTLFSLLVMAVSLQLIPIEYVDVALEDLYESDRVQLTYFITALIFFVISLRFLFMGYKRNKPAPSIVQFGELGDIKITLDTIETLAVKASKKIRAIRDLKAKVQPTENGTIIHLKVSVDGETPIPQLTDELQKNVKHDIEHIAGIQVEKVTVVVSEVQRTPMPRSRVE
ncbi:MAG: alkaline shock response membrane anchor protein AmaP [Bacillaceae bacterium]|nr:alkaline shock response membrane anchor protein AmaP [Bacillaceae bacterium]